TPVAQLKPVSIGGVTVSSATLHNEEQIEKLGVQEEAEVEITRAGDVIPKVIRVLKPGREKFKMPNRCPECQTPVGQIPGLIGRRCPNILSCPAQIEGRIIHFASKDALNIDGLGPQWIAALLEKNIIHHPSDL